MTRQIKLLPVHDCQRDCYYFDYYDNGQGECPPTCLQLMKQNINPFKPDEECPLHSIGTLLTLFLNWLDQYNFLIADPLRTDKEPCKNAQADEWEKQLMITEFIMDEIQGGIYE